jgi:ADP-ribose pyrophosphatase
MFELGLMDDGETPEQTAIRELEEETGYVADKVIETSPILVADPGAVTIFQILQFR